MLLLSPGMLLVGLIMSSAKITKTEKIVEIETKQGSSEKSFSRDIENIGFFLPPNIWNIGYFLLPPPQVLPLPPPTSPGGGGGRGMEF